MDGRLKGSLLALCFFVVMAAFGIAAALGGYKLGIGSRDLDGAANTIAGILMIAIGVNEARRQLTALLRERRA